MTRLVGGLVETLEKIGQLENTYVFVISDHGEMIGERGMWYKFNPYEGSVRVPIIAMGPGLKQGHCETALTTLVDLLPTFADIANGGSYSDFARPLMVEVCSIFPRREVTTILSSSNIAARACMTRH